VPPVNASESRLGQVFLNLLVNAAHAIPEGNSDTNTIRVTTSVEAGRVVVSVADSGSGIPPEVQERLFTPFFTTKEPGVGTGLGLSICHQIVTALQGDISFESEIGKGSVFRVSLPAERAPAQAQAPAEPVLVPTAAVAPRQARVLVVDDDKCLLDAITIVLRRDHDVTAVGSAQSALELLAGGEVFDVILCDLMMPQMTGMEFHAELLRRDPVHAARMVFMTAGAFTAHASQFLDDVANRRVDKPFNTASLRSLINEFLH
jgi:CheY-like chemotaxis protein